MLLSLFIVPYVEIQWLFLAIVVMNFFAYIIARRLPTMKESHNAPLPGFKKIYSKIIHVASLKFFKKEDRIPVIAITVVRKLVATLPSGYLAIFTFVSSGDIRQAIIIAALTNLPGMFSVFLGKITDIHPRRSLVFGLALMASAFVGFSFADTFMIQMIIAFVAGVATQIMYLSSMVVIKQSTLNEHLGNVDSMITSIGSLSEIVGVVAFGFLIDRVGLTSLGFSVAIGLYVSCVWIYWWFFIQNK